MKDKNGIRSVAAEMSDSGKNFIALLDAIRSFLEELDDTRLITFLADWPPANCRMRSVAPHALPVLSWLPEAVKAATAIMSNAQRNRRIIVLPPI